VPSPRGLWSGDDHGWDFSRRSAGPPGDLYPLWSTATRDQLFRRRATVPRVPESRIQQEGGGWDGATVPDPKRLCLGKPWCKGTFGPSESYTSTTKSSY